MKINLHFLRGLILPTIIIFSMSMKAQEKFILNGADIVSYSDYTHLPNFIKFQPNTKISIEEFNDWAKQAFHLTSAISFKPYNVENDKLGFSHVRFKQYFNQYPVDGSMLIAHVKDGNIISVNGDFYTQVNVSPAIAINEEKALQNALKKVNAKKYKWENQVETAQMKIATGDPLFSYFPKAEFAYIPKAETNNSSHAIQLAYKFNIYAEQPLSRSNVYVDVQTGEVITQVEILHTADVNGTANSLYSGNVNIVCDNYAPGQYRLQEAGRGNGIKTYNSQTSPVHSNTDFTSTSSNWNLPAIDKAAADAHWGAEKTYDYYSQVHTRNSIDGNGFTLLNYVHYDLNMANAFWDGQRMSYGDGDGGNYSEMVSLDICAHEITHGLVQYTAMLGTGGLSEPDAINEAWSDIMATSIESFTKPAQWDWVMGADVTFGGVGMRIMSDPKTSPTPHPDTYFGQHWSGFGEPHINSGPAIYWFYLLSQGGSGMNDQGENYNISGITISKAQMIAYRALTVYASPNTNYSNMRACTIMAAQDLYGACSPEVIATTNAWYAVGVGNQFSNFVSTSFTANITSICSVPFTVDFINTTTNASTALWNFGDNTTSTQYNPSHTYTSPGSYTVTLTVGGGCGSGVLTKTSYITITPPSSPTTSGANSCSPASLTLNASGSNTLNWYTAVTGGTPINTGTTYTTPLLNTTTTYYVENSIAGPSGSAGPANNSFGSGIYGNSAMNRFQTFNVIKPCTLVSVLVYANTAGNRTINLWDNSGNILQTWTINIPTGSSTVTLNAHLMPGNGYRLGGSFLNLYNNNSGANYPYTYAGYLSITGNNSSSNSYYYFYNWQIQAAPCVSARIPVIASIGPLVPVTYNASAYDTVCSDDVAFTLSGGNPSGGSYSGTGINNGIFDPAVSGTGNFTITYSHTDAGNCTGTATQTIYVLHCTGIKDSDTNDKILVYPNPSSGNISLEIVSSKEENAQMIIINSLGQNVFSQQHKLMGGVNKLMLELSNLSKGIYFIQMRTDSAISSKKIEIN